jgi:hypothetical protein
MPVVMVDLDDGHGLRPADELETRGTPVPNDLPYFVEAARTAAALATGVERFVVSYSPVVGRSLSERDVLIFVGDETATPLPHTPVCPEFRTYGERFAVPCRNVRRDLPLAAAEAALFARNRARGVLRRPRPLSPRRPEPGRLPLGMPGFPEPRESVPRVAERPFDVGFRGSTTGERPFAPKRLSRQRMLAALERLPAGVVVDLVETESFSASYSLDPASYAQSLLDTKICLAPRGGSIESYRVFEGALAGCVVVTEPLPSAWFYEGLPHRELKSWSELRGVVEELLADPAGMQAMSDAGREWAENVVSARAIGEWIAARLEDVR